MHRSKIFFLLLTIIITGAAHGQAPASYRHLLRAYEDNDIINIPGQGTDRGYSNGTRIDYYVIKDKPVLFFLNRIMPKAGDSSINTFGFGLMQVIYTPKNTIRRIPDKNDYAYAGGLFATHSLHSTNAIKKFSWQTEWMLGVMGPPSLAKNTQRTAHKMVGMVQPGGWDYQLKTDLLLNLSVAAEKQLAHINKIVECIGGAQLQAGTALNGASLYSILRFGKMNPWFNGYIPQFSSTKQYSNRTQVYGFIRPTVDYTLTHALIDGGVFNYHNQPVPESEPVTTGEPELPNRVRNRLTGKLAFGLAASVGRLGISCSHTILSPVIKGTGSLTIGNISLYYAW